ncbi:MAG: glycoside hydrolase family 9 protein [Hyphomonas sp.]|nr:glycoside hydrolase family 9 protein [Hyphomonas sp.]
MVRAAVPALLLGALPILAGCARAEIYPDIAPAGTTPALVADQFGYRPQDEKILIVRRPKEGFDANTVMPAHGGYEFIDTDTGKVAFRAEAQVWNFDSIDPASGDRVAYVDFSDLDTPGSYSVRSADRANWAGPVRIGPDVYDEAFRAAFRTFFYQRAGFAKAVPYADARWTDGASHLGPGQDTEARSFFAKDDAATARDLHGGWYDAGDFNKYTNWTADYCLTLLASYAENPGAWGDDFGLPESGNDIPDVLDEVKWGLDWLVRMQSEDGSVLSIVSLDTASPPSAATGPSYYGPASTSATRSAAAAFAYAAPVYEAAGQADFAADLRRRAMAAWDWAEANPDVVFRNNDARDQSEGLGAGQQEVDDAGRAAKRLTAAVYLFALTGDEVYRLAAEEEIAGSRLMLGEGVTPYNIAAQDAMLAYAGLPGISDGLADAIREAFAAAMAGPAFMKRIKAWDEAYLTPVWAMHWGSSAVKARTGTLFLDAARTGVADADRAGARYLHYFHGVNPLGKVFLSNMGELGAENSVDSFYHGWFADGSEKWDSVSGSEFGPAPGFVVGGPNPYYKWDPCCPKSCGNPNWNFVCFETPLEPPAGQPPLKSYRDFNTSWPLNSWEVTENSNGYQAAYLRLAANYIE